ncbi:MAG: PQQ-dependent sugar dehydrogenase [Proteobacteria bacterium]|nr:PQQ-dependent sugar dehydrogenase [Pseudomonadota bacterium]
MGGDHQGCRHPAGINARKAGLALAVFLAAPALAQPKDEPRVEVVAKGLSNPWGLAFLPDGRALVTERPGRLRIVNLRTGTSSGPIEGVPKVSAQGQGGLLGLALAPDFATSREVFLCFSEAREGGSGSSVFRGRLAPGGTSLEDGQVIFRQMPAGNTTRHFGCRLVFGRDGTLFVTLGDRGNMSDAAQKLDGHIGKVIRIRRDGSVPPDNPFVGRAEAKPEIWSYGHRNIQGATLQPETGALFTVEHGARGGDEINRPEAGKNYGWPVITYGIDYSGAKIGIGPHKEGMEQPLFYWDPSIAPSGATFYRGDKFPSWRGSLLVGALAGSLLARIEFRDGKVTGETRYLESLGERIRDVVEGPDGYPYLLTDSPNGQLLRLVPKG